MTYFILYIVLFPIIFILVKPYSRYHKLPFIFVAIFSILRYDTTSDYLSYVELFYDVNDNLVNRTIEPTFVLFSKVFNFVDYGYIYVIVIYCIISYYLIYRLFAYYGILYWGSVFFLLFQLPFVFDNVIRQSVSIAIFAYSLQYVLNDKNKYLLLNLIGLLFHYSAFICFFLYFFMKALCTIKMNKVFALISILILFIFYRFGINDMIVKYLISFTPYSNYVDLLNLFKSEVNSGLGVLLKTLIICLPVFIWKNQDSKEIKMLINMSYIAACMYLFSVSFSLINRLNSYLYIYTIMALAIYCTKEYGRRILVYTSILPLLALYIVYVINYYGINNVYYTVFSDRCKERIFYKRQFELGDAFRALLNDREATIKYWR